MFAIDLDIEMGMGQYYSGAQGRIEYTDTGFKGSYSIVELENHGQFYLWADITSKVSYLPKLRLQYLKISTSGDSILHLASEQDFPADIEDLIDLFNDQPWNSGLSQNIYDVYLYYEFFEKSPWPSVGLGLGLKSFDYAYNVELILPIQIGDRGGKSVPMVFLSSRYEVPNLQLGFEVESETYIFGDSTLYDLRAKMDLMFPIDEVTQAGFEMGYRESYYDLRGSDVETFKANMRYSGLYVGLVATFK